MQSETTDICVDKIDGNCFVRYLTDPDEIKEWLEEPDHFYIHEEEDEDGGLKPLDRATFRQCETCLNVREEMISRNQRLKNCNQPLRGMELFSGQFLRMVSHSLAAIILLSPGAGGLGVGMEMSGFVETQYAVEISPSAAATYQ